MACFGSSTERWDHASSRSAIFLKGKRQRQRSSSKDARTRHRAQDNSGNDETVNNCHATSTLYGALGKINEAYRAVALPLVCYMLSHQSLEFTKRLDGSEAWTAAECMGVAWLCWLPTCVCDADVNSDTSLALQKI